VTDFVEPVEADESERSSLAVVLIRLTFGGVVMVMGFTFVWFIVSVWVAMRSVA